MVIGRGKGRGGTGRDGDGGGGRGFSGSTSYLVAFPHQKNAPALGDCVVFGNYLFILQVTRPAFRKF